MKLRTLALLPFLLLVAACTASATLDSPPQDWVSHSPQSYYTISLPQDWSEEFAGAYRAQFVSPENYGQIIVSDLRPATNERTFEDPVGHWRLAAEGFRGFRLLESYDISPNVKRTIFRYDKQPNGGCGATLDILHVLTARHVFHVVVTGQFDSIMEILFGFMPVGLVLSIVGMIGYRGYNAVQGMRGGGVI